MDKNARRSEPKKVGDWANPYIYIIYRYLYIYHLEGHAEKTRDRSGIYRKKELHSFQSHTKKEAHSRTKWGTKGNTGVLGWPFTMGGVRWGMGLRAKSPHTPAGSPRTAVPFTGEQGWHLGVECFCGAGWDLLPAGWFCSPRWWHLVGSLLRSPMDHLQRPEHPSPEPGPSSLCLTADTGGAGHCCSGSRGWVAIIGFM